MSRAEAERAWELAKSSPAEGLHLANTVLEHAVWTVAATALAARGRAHFELGNNERAVADLRAGLEGLKGPFRSRVAMALAAAVAAKGETEEAAALLHEVIDDNRTSFEADAALQGLALSQLGYLLVNIGELRQATETLRRSTTLLDPLASEQDALARVLLNLGCCEILLGDFDNSLRTLDQAVELAKDTGQDMIVACCFQNRAYAYSRFGELPKALAALDEARDLYVRAGDPGRALSTLFDDYAETYRLAGMTGDAVDHARRALRHIEGGGNLEQEADATYRLAVCLLDDGDHERAVEVAERAETMFCRAGRSLGETRAALVALEAAGAELSATDEHLDRAERATAELDRTGWHSEALRLRNRMALIGLRLADRALVERFLIDQLPTSDQTVVGRLECLLHGTISDLHRGGTGEPALGEAWSTLQAHRQRLADPELRAGSGRLAEAFRFAALVGASASGESGALLAAEERWRAASLRLPRARPSQDPAVADTSQRLRDVTRQARELDTPDPELEQQIRRMEDRLRRVSHQASTAAAPATATVDNPAEPTTADRQLDGPQLVAELTERLDGQRLVEWFEHRGLLYGLAIEAGRIERWEVGPVAEIRSAVDRIRRDLARLLYAPGAGDTGRRWNRVRERAVDLSSRLFGRLWRGPGLVLCPPGPLQELPWPLLIPHRETPVTVAFSATAWLSSHRRLPNGGALTDPSVRFVAGPDLDDAHHDHRVARQRFPTAGVTEVADRQVLADAIRSADLLHITAHGTFRASSPMFSSLRLADGDFALHELADFDRFPSVVALAACDAGRSLHLGEVAEQLGAAPAWLGAGVHTVIAPVCAVPDEATGQFFNRFYDALPGQTPAEALARVWVAVADAEPALAGTAAAILCVGNGGPTIGVGS